MFERARQQQADALVLPPEQAFVAAIVGSVNADGSISPEEAARLDQLFRPPSGAALPPVTGEVMRRIFPHLARNLSRVAFGVRSRSRPNIIPRNAVSGRLVALLSETQIAHRSDILP